MDWFKMAAWVVIFGSVSLMLLGNLWCIVDYEKDKAKPPKHETLGRYVALLVFLFICFICAWTLRPY